jgi:hypothetical protein
MCFVVQHTENTQRHQFHGEHNSLRTWWQNEHLRWMFVAFGSTLIWFTNAKVWFKMSKTRTWTFLPKWLWTNKTLEVKNGFCHHHRFDNVCLFWMNHRSKQSIICSIGNRSGQHDFVTEWQCPRETALTKGYPKETRRKVRLQWFPFHLGLKCVVEIVIMTGSEDGDGYVNPFPRFRPSVALVCVWGREVVVTTKKIKSRSLQRAIRAHFWRHHNLKSVWEAVRVLFLDPVILVLPRFKDSPT